MPNIGNSISCVTNASAKPTTTFVTASMKDISRDCAGTSTDLVVVAVIWQLQTEGSKSRDGRAAPGIPKADKAIDVLEMHAVSVWKIQCAGATDRSEAASALP